MVNPVKACHRGNHGMANPIKIIEITLFVFGCSDDEHLVSIHRLIGIGKLEGKNPSILTKNKYQDKYN